MTGAATKTETYTYIYEGQSIAMEILSKVENGGAPVKEVTRYVHSQRIDEPLAMERGGQYYFFHANRLGSVAAITNTVKAIVQSGMPEPSTSFRNSNTYTGREWDGETGLYHYRPRYYDPMAGRFVSKDPIGFAGGLNLYNYVGGNPVNRKDPLGLFDWVNPIDYWGDFFGGTGDFYWNFNDMNKTNIKNGGDKYFHCKANCEAARRGQGGEDAACLLSNAKELKDVYWTGHPVSDSAADQAANRSGSEGGANTNLPCEIVCQPYRPNGMPLGY